MSINCRQLRDYVVRPTLAMFGVDDEATENLLLGTSAQESLMGKYIVQMNGSALGIYQIEPRTHADVYGNYLGSRQHLKYTVDSLSTDKYNSMNREEELIYNLRYATAIAYIIYLRAPKDIPSDPLNVNAMAAFWKAYYNTHLGKGTEHEFINNYRRYVK